MVGFARFARFVAGISLHCTTVQLTVSTIENEKNPSKWCDRKSDSKDGR